jgi:hypothetical protein
MDEFEWCTYGASEVVCACYVMDNAGVCFHEERAYDDYVL